jgi:hypothetical protein
MRNTTYVAQALVAPSERRVEGIPLKADIRNFAYAGVVKLVAARSYQGQTTNFRTAGGGFAPISTEKKDFEPRSPTADSWDAEFDGHEFKFSDCRLRRLPSSIHPRPAVRCCYSRCDGKYDSGSTTCRA